MPATETIKRPRSTRATQKSQVMPRIRTTLSDKSISTSLGDAKALETSSPAELSPAKSTLSSIFHGKKKKKKSGVADKTSERIFRKMSNSFKESRGGDPFIERLERQASFSTTTDSKSDNMDINPEDLKAVSNDLGWSIPQGKLVQNLKENKTHTEENVSAT